MYENKIVRYNLEIKNTSPLLIGTGEDSVYGLQIKDGYAKIPGTTLAGIFRNELYKSENVDDLYRAIYLENPEKKEKRLIKKKEKRLQSMMSIEDSFSKEKINFKNDIGERTNISLDERTGAAKLKKLFKTLYIQEGQVFNLEIEFRKVLQDNKSSKELEFKEKEDEFLLKQAEEEFDKFIEKLHREYVTIGAYENQGFGKFEVLKHSKTRYKFNNERDRDAYINDVTEPLEQYKLTELTNKKIDKFIVEITCKEGMIIKNQKSKKDNEVYSFKEKNNEFYTIPSSTLKGLARGYFESLVNPEDDIIKVLFGSEDSKGKLKFQDIKIKKFKELKKHRICINRFTGGAIKGAYLNEFLITWTEPVPWIFDFTNIENKELRKDAKLIILNMIKSLALGEIRIGSGSTIGYGKLDIKKIDVILS